MDWFLYRTAAVLFILGVVVEINSEFRVQVRDYNSKNGTIKWHSSRRQKREWIKFAAACREGEDNSKRNPIAKIHSDCAKDQQVTYRISGVGIDQPPYGVFVINPKTGEINITAIVDREVNPYFIIYCRALNAQGQDLENVLELRVRVLDINDNPPVFSMTEFVGSVEENSYANTLVMVINATDADEPNNLNSKIAFKIVSQEPADSPMFILNRYSGELRTMNPFLDREKYAMYSLVVRGSDRDGGGDGLSAQSDCKITILDVNDNFPRLELPTYTINIKENMISQEMARFRVIDLDQEGTDNWLALFFFISGNEGGWFEIVTDEMTNEGIFRVIKPLNYEEIQNMQLSIGVRNKAEFHHSVASQYKIEATVISVSVENVIEGSVFAPASNTYRITKDMGKNSVIGSMVATDLDTGGPSKTVRYIMGTNPGGLLAVNERTGQLTLNNVITREVYQRLNGHYEGTILSIDDTLQRTCTGTIILDMKDLEDLKTGTDTNGPGDNNGGGTDDGSRDNTGETSTNHQEDITTNNYDITSTSGYANGNGVEGYPGDNVHFGPAGIGLLIMGFLVLGLVPFLLIACDCGGASGVGGGFEPVPECTEGAIHSWAVEGPQPDDINNICVPVIPVIDATGNMNECIDTAGVYTNEYGEREMRDLGEGGIGTSRFELSNGVKTSAVPEVCTGYSGTLRRNSMRECREGGLNMNFMESYFCQKAFAYADEDENRPSNDCLLIYDIEGVGSSAGSVGCCSFIGEDEDDSFLDTLGPKFKKLADISLGKEIDSYPDVDHTWPPENTEPSCPPQGNDVSFGHPPMSPHFGTTTVVSESTYPSGPVVQHPMPIPDPLGYGNVTVTESYTTTGSLQPPVHIHDPRHGSNVVVTERVVGPISGSDLQGMLDLTDFREGSNVVVTERVIAPNSRLPTSLSIPDPRDTSNVVVTERVIRPTSGLMGNLSIHPDLSSAHNVVVTERVVSGAGVTGISGGGVSSVVGSNVSRGAITMSGGGVSMSGGGIGLSGSGISGGGIEMSSLGSGGGGLSSIGLNSSGLSGSSTLGHVRNSDHFNQTIGSASPSTTRSRITKYSTIQYSKQ
ncbi:desmoglein-1 [Phascolarctos cinereus]|uniref:Desmoglein-1 n=1 Tax=Phascolarctos cinereus TaxID=38626 RepID=A0A6P5KT80_PHACI|nr:desmoglein-1 [Phascolarctos cinereus]